MNVQENKERAMREIVLNQTVMIFHRLLPEVHKFVLDTYGEVTTYLVEKHYPDFWYDYVMRN